MRYKYRYAKRFTNKNIFSEEYRQFKRIIDILEKSNHPYSYDKDVTNTLIVEVYYESALFPIIHEEFKDKYPIVSTEYTEQEFNDATWYSVWSKWRFDYPILDNEKGPRTFSEDYLCSECRFGEEQIGSYILKKAPKWGRDKYFCSTNWSNTLFVSNEGNRILQDANIKGYHLIDVLKAGNMEPFEDFHQIYIEQILGKGYIEREDRINAVLDCDVCKRKRISVNGMEQYFDKRIFDNIDVDILHSNEWFGSFHQIIISKKFYGTIMKNKLDRNLVIEPLFLV